MIDRVCFVEFLSLSIILAIFSLLMRALLLKTLQCIHRVCLSLGVRTHSYTFFSICAKTISYCLWIPHYSKRRYAFCCLLFTCFQQQACLLISNTTTIKQIAMNAMLKQHSENVSECVWRWFQCMHLFSFRSITVGV